MTRDETICEVAPSLHERLAYAFDAEGNNNHPSVLAAVALGVVAPELAALDAAEAKLAAVRARFTDQRPRAHVGEAIRDLRADVFAILDRSGT